MKVKIYNDVPCDTCYINSDRNPITIDTKEFKDGINAIAFIQINIKCELKDICKYREEREAVGHGFE